MWTNNGAPRGPAWLVIANTIAQRADQFTADPEHSPAARWPTAGELATEFGVTPRPCPATIAAELRVLRKGGALNPASPPSASAQHCAS